MEIRELIAQTIQGYYGDKLEYPLVEKILNLPVSEERMCDMCKGTGLGRCDHNCNADCDDCNGTGKQTKTLKQLIEETQK